MGCFDALRGRGRLAAALLGAGGMLLACGGGDDGLGANVPEPEIVRSRGGVLQIQLTQAPAMITVAGHTFRSNVFNGQYIPPVLKMKRGDRLQLQLVNRIGAASGHAGVTSGSARG